MKKSAGVILLLLLLLYSCRIPPQIIGAYSEAWNDESITDPEWAGLLIGTDWSVVVGMFDADTPEDFYLIDIPEGLISVTIKAFYDSDMTIVNEFDNDPTIFNWYCDLEDFPCVLYERNSENELFPHENVIGQEVLLVNNPADLILEVTAEASYNTGGYSIWIKGQ